MSTPAREGETIEGSRTMRNRPYPVLKCGATIFLLLVTAVPVQRDGRYPLGEHVTALFWECAPPLAQSRTQWLRRVGEQALQGCGTGAGR